MNVRSFVASLLVLTSVMFTGGSARAQEVTLKIATIPIDAGAEVYYAQDQGFFDKQGLTAKIQSIPNGAAIASAVASGSLDIGYSNLISLAIAHARGVPVTVIAPAGLYSTNAPTSVCIVAKNSPIKTAKDLDGKIFATNGLRNITEYAPRAWMDKNGGDSKTLKFTEMPLSEMAVALTRGTVDAALSAEPFLTQGKEQTRVLSKCYDGVATNFMIAAYFTTTTWAKAHPELVRKFADAIRATADWANKNHAASAAILARETKIAPEVANTMVRSVYPETSDPKLMQPMIDVAAKYGALSAAFPASELIYKP